MSRTLLKTEEEFSKHFLENSKLRECQGHMDKVHTIDWNCDGRRLASGSFDRTISIYSLAERLTNDGHFTEHQDSVDQVKWHPRNADLLVSASLDKTVRFWDIRTRKCVSCIPTRGENINMNWSPDGRIVAVGNKEDVVTFIDVRTRKIRTEQPFKFEANEFCWNKDNDLFFITSGTGNVHVLSYPQMIPQKVIQAHPATCIALEFDPSGRYFAVGATDSTVSIWDVYHMACLKTITRHEFPIRTISFSCDGTLLASGSEDASIDICHVESGMKVASINNDCPSFTVSFHPKKYLLAYACDDKITPYYGRNDVIRPKGTIKIFGFSNDS